MDIKTKYSLGDTIWTIDHDKVVSIIVNCIRICCESYGEVKASGGTAMSVNISQSILYKGEYSDFHCEDECYPSKEELINSLL